jgi:hypothetical protein
MPDRPSPNHPIERMSSDSFACPRPPLSCIDAALDGQLAELYPETQGGQVIVRVDGYDLPQEEVREFFARFSSCVLHVPGYAAALHRNEWVGGVEFELNLEHLKH